MPWANSSPDSSFSIAIKASSDRRIGFRFYTVVIHQKTFQFFAVLITTPRMPLSRTSRFVPFPMIKYRIFPSCINPLFPSAMGYCRELQEYPQASYLEGSMAFHGLIYLYITAPGYFLKRLTKLSFIRFQLLYAMFFLLLISPIILVLIRSFKTLYIVCFLPVIHGRKLNDYCQVSPGSHGYG